MAQEIVIQDGFTGTEPNTGKTKIEPTDEFVKVSRYLNVIFAYHGIPLSLVPISLLLAQRMAFKTNIIYLLKRDKEEIAEMLGVSNERVRTLLKECVKHDIIRSVSRGMYEVNAYLFSTGSMVETRELQAHFDFQRESFIVHADQKDLITGETVRKAVVNKREKQIEGQMSFDDYLGMKSEQKTIPEQKKKQPKQSQKKNKFNDIEQHDYDFKAIEDALTQ